MKENQIMTRRQRTIRGVDDDAWEILQVMREAHRTEMGALVSEAIRSWYAQLDDDAD